MHSVEAKHSSGKNGGEKRKTCTPPVDFAHFEKKWSLRIDGTASFVFEKKISLFGSFGSFGQHLLLLKMLRVNDDHPSRRILDKTMQFFHCLFDAVFFEPVDRAPLTRVLPGKWVPGKGGRGDVNIQKQPPHHEI